MANGINIYLGPTPNNRVNVIDPTSFQMTWSLGARATCEFVMKDIFNQSLATAHECGHRCRVTQNDVIIFDGTIDDYTLDCPSENTITGSTYYPSGGRINVIRVRAVSYEQFLDKQSSDLPQFDGLGVIDGSFITGFSGTTITLAGVGFGMTVGSAVYYEGSSGTIPSGVLYVVSVSGNDIQLALTAGGSAIAVSGGTGDHWLYPSALSVVKAFCLVDGIVAGTMRPGALIRHYAPEKTRLSIIADDMARASGYTWWVGLDFLVSSPSAAKALFFVPPGYMTAPFDIDESATDYRALQPMSLRRTREQYANKAYVKLAPGSVTGVYTLNLVGDSAKRAWRVEPAIESIRLMTVNGTAVELGVYGQDTGFDWYYTPKGHWIIQDSSGTLLTSSDTINLDYIRHGLGWVSASDATAIADRASKEAGTTGEYHRIEETDLPSVEAGEDYAAALVALWKNVPDEVTYDIRANLLFPGYTQHITAPTWGIDGDYMINSVRGYLEDNASNDDGIDRRFRYRVAAISTVRMDEYLDTFRKFLEGGGPSGAVSSGGAVSLYYTVTWGLAIGQLLDLGTDYSPRFVITRGGVPTAMKVTNKGTWPSGQDAIVDIFRIRGGTATSIFGATKLHIPVGGTGAVNNIITFDTFASAMSFQADDVLRLDVTQIGTTFEGRDITVEMLVRASS